MKMPFGVFKGRLFGELPYIYQIFLLTKLKDLSNDVKDLKDLKEFLALHYHTITQKRRLFNPRALSLQLERFEKTWNTELLAYTQAVLDRTKDLSQQGLQSNLPSKPIEPVVTPTNKTSESVRYKFPWETSVKSPKQK